MSKEPTTVNKSYNLKCDLLYLIKLKDPFILIYKKS